MKMQDILIRKFTSRKFWIAVAGLVSGLIITLGGDAETGQNVSGVILSISSIIAYVAGEGIVDVTSQNRDTEDDLAD